MQFTVELGMVYQPAKRSQQMAKNLEKFPIPPLTDDDDLLVEEPPPREKINMRTVLEDVFTELGGTEGVTSWVRQSTANQRIFYRDMLPKLIPREERHEHTGADGGPVKYVIEWAGGPPDPAKRLEDKTIDVTVIDDD